MSHLLAASLTNRAASAAISACASSARHLVSHPVVPLKGFSTSSPLHHHYLRLCSNDSSSSSFWGSTTGHRDIERISKNVSRLYARRVLELAAMSAATLAAKTNMEAMIEKPSEWGTIDLDEQKRVFGETISSLGSNRFSRLWAAGSRIFSLSLLASPLAILVPVSYLTGSNSKLSNLAWNYALWSIEKAGPTFIKLVQWATTRNDLFSADFVTRFSKLQDNTRGHTWAETATILEKSFGPNYDELFLFEDVEAHYKHKRDTDSAITNTRKRRHRNKNDLYIPIGSGCVAQVYKAKLKNNNSSSLYPKGTDVAIKVTHPHILHKVCVDFYILNKITSLLEMIPYANLDYLSMKDSVQQFRDIMLPQLDLRIEARNLTRFRRDFANEKQISFPAPIMVTNHVLVETYVNGEPILDFMKEGHSNPEDRKELAKIGLEAVMKMIFLHDFIHADLHPGNILVDRNLNTWGKLLRVNMIDCGLVVEMGENDHINLVKILGALIRRDGLVAGRLMVDTARKCQANQLDVKMFCEGIQRICEDDEDQNFLESVGDYLADICHLACKHKVKLEASFINAALACEIMEGIASALYPDMEVQKIALPMVFKAEVMHGLKGNMKFF